MVPEELIGVDDGISYEQEEKDSANFRNFLKEPWVKEFMQSEDDN